jgi:hypothetical protein
MSTVFRYRGLYRVQSRRARVYSEIDGEWWDDRDGLLCSDVVNDVLRQSPLWLGDALVRLRAASVTRRSGLFHSDPDVLVKKQFFTPAENSDEMTDDFVDVHKSVRYWFERQPYYHALLGKNDAEALEQRITDLDLTIANEYFCHEAGHLVGYDVRSKYADGYFRVNGKAAWPLIFVEEFRADLHAFGVALRVLSPKHAAQVFLYNLLLRFGLEASAYATQSQAYGAVPYLLFHLLRSLGFLLIEQDGEGSSKLRLADVSDTAVLTVMAACAEHAAEHLTQVEVDTRDPLEAAICSAAYYRVRALHTEATSDYVAAFRRLQVHGRLSRGLE